MSAITSRLTDRALSRSISLRLLCLLVSSGSAMLIAGPYKWLGADRITSLEFAMEHIAVIGGLLAVARLAAVETQFRSRLGQNRIRNW